MGIQEVELERAGEKSAIDGSDPVCSFFIIIIHNIITTDIIIRQNLPGRVTRDSYKLQTKAIYHSTRRYMNRRERQSDQPIHVPLLHVLGFPPSDVHCRHSRATRATPSNHTQRYASCNCSELCCYSIEYTETILYRQNRVRSRSSGDPQRRSAVRPIRVCALCGVMQLWPYEQERLS